MPGTTGTSDLVIEPLTGRAGFRVAGDVDFGSRAVLAAALNDLFDRVPPPARSPGNRLGIAGAGAGDIHLDLVELGFIDMGGATLLAVFARRLEPGRRLILHDPPGQLLRILDLMWTDRATIEVVQA